MKDLPYTLRRCWSGTLPGRKPLIRTLSLHLVQPRHKLGFHVAGRHGDLNLALQAGIQRLGNLHRQNLRFQNPRNLYGPAVQPAGMFVPEWLMNVRAERAVLPAAAGWDSLRSTRAVVSKSLFFQCLTEPVSCGSFSPVTIATPFVTRDADFQHFFARLGAWNHLSPATLTE